MATPAWLNVLLTVGLAALQASPIGVIAGPVAAGIAIAKDMHDKTGAEKLQHVIGIAVQAATVAQAAGVKIDPAMVAQVAGKAISTAVDVTNIVHDAHAPDAPAK